MKIKSRNHVYECVPPFLDNRKLPESEQVVIGLKVVPMPEAEDFRQEMGRIAADYSVDKAAELQRDKTLELVGSKFAFVHGLEIEGISLDENGGIPFKTFYDEAPPELVTWVCRAVMSTTELSMAERKNWSGGSASV